jgi:porin
MGSFHQFGSSTLLIAVAIWALPSAILAKPAVEALSSPDATGNILASNEVEKDSLMELETPKAWLEWKSEIEENTWIDFGFDYNFIGFAATASLGEDSAAGGVFRFYGTWDLIRPNGPNTGTLVYKIENRHGLTDVSPAGLGIELGYAGGLTGAFSDENSWRATNLYWQQKFANDSGVAFVGWLDTTDYVDVYALPSPWTGFSNRAFQTGTGTIAGLNDGTLGAMVSGFLTDKIYAVAGIVDANGVATDPFDGFNTLFNNAHLTFWQIDARKDAGTPEGYGVAFSFSRAIEGVWLPFIRGGWSDGGDSLYNAAVSIGLAYSKDLERSLFAVGLNWSRPNDEAFGAKLDDQLTLEVFQRSQLTENIQVTPSLQVIYNPALNPNTDAIAIVGIRLRAAF